ncbi:MAG: glycosyltransferase [Candidatus Roizmanbacteria bacterium]|nr:glycosyltransferase [Candidatus Roizmanbacteria bacterium]
MNITLAIPHVGDTSHLSAFLQNKSLENAKHIYILDDNTDEEILSKLTVSPPIELIRSKTRLYPTKSRNRMLSLEGEDIILFLDNDMEVHTPNFLAHISDYFQKDSTLGVLSGQVKRLNGLTDWFSYGKFLSPFDMKHLDIWTQVAWKYRKQKEIFDWIIEQAGHMSYNFWTNNEEQVVDWVYEGFFAVRTSLFTQLHGFDEAFKMFHDGPDFCLRTQKAGYKVLWTPSIQITHKKTINISNVERDAIMDNATAYWYKKHFSINEDVFKRLKDLNFTS